MKTSIIILNIDTTDFTDFQKKVNILYIAKSLENGKIKEIINSFIPEDSHRIKHIKHYLKIFRYFALFVWIKKGRDRVRF